MNAVVRADEEEKSLKQPSYGVGRPVRHGFCVQVVEEAGLVEEAELSPQDWFVETL